MRGQQSLAGYVSTTRNEQALCPAVHRTEGAEMDTVLGGYAPLDCLDDETQCKWVKFF